MQTQRTHWPSILVLTVLALGILVFLLSTLISGVISIAGLFDESADPVGGMVRAFASGFELIVVMICAWFVLQKTMQKGQADQSIRFPFSLWQVIAIPGIVIFSIGLGASVTISQIKWLGWLTLPALTLLAVVLPIVFFLGIGANGIEFGPRWKTWGALGLSLTLSPFVMIVLEIVVLLIFAIVGVIALSTQPALIQEITRVGKLLNEGVSNEAAVELLAPYIAKPAAIASLFLFLSLFVPLIEEFFKPLAVWLFANRLQSPANGFALGLLSGGAFALIESLNVSSDGSASWFVIVFVRAGTSLLHMTTSGMMGYTIVQLFQEKKVGRFIVTYLTAAALHGIWNAAAAGAALATIGEMIGKPEWLLNLPAALSGLAILAAGMFAVLLAANRKVRASQTIALAPQLGANEEGVK